MWPRPAGRWRSFLASLFRAPPLRVPFVPNPSAAPPPPQRGPVSKLAAPPEERAAPPGGAASGRGAGAPYRGTLVAQWRRASSVSLDTAALAHGTTELQEAISRCGQIVLRGEIASYKPKEQGLVELGSRLGFLDYQDEPEHRARPISLRFPAAGRRWPHERRASFAPLTELARGAAWRWGVLLLSEDKSFLGSVTFDRWPSEKVSEERYFPGEEQPVIARVLWTDLHKLTWGALQATEAKFFVLVQRAAMSPLNAELLAEFARRLPFGLQKQPAQLDVISLG